MNIFKVYLLDESITFEDKIFLTGFRSHIGQTGYIAVRHLADSLNAKKIGIIDTTYLPPSAFMGENGILNPFELYLLDNFVILYLRAVPQRMEWNFIARELSKWVKEKKFKEAVLIGGLDNEFKTGDERLKISATSEFLKKNPNIKYPKLTKELGIYGLLALFLSYFELFKVPAIALLSYAEKGRPDPRAAAVAIEEINKLYNKNFDTTALIKDAEEIEKEIELIMSQQQEYYKERKEPGMFV